MNKTNNGKRLLAAIAVFAMVACVLAVAAPVAADDTSDSTFGGTYVADPAKRGDASAIMTDIAQISFINQNDEEFIGYGNTTNSSIGNKNLYIEKVNGSTVKVTGILANNDGKTGFDYQDFDYGFIINISDLTNTDNDGWGFGTDEKPYYIYYTNAIGGWTEKELTADTTSQLIYVDAERDDTTYYFSATKLEATSESQVPAGTPSLTVEWDFTFGKAYTSVAEGDVTGINDAMKNGDLVILDGVTSIASGLEVTESGIMIDAPTQITSATFNLGSYEGDTFTPTATVTLENFKGTVIFKKGSAEITQGQIDAGGVTIEDETEVIIDNVTVNNNATITVDAGATVKVGSNVVINEGATLYIKNADAASASAGDEIKPVDVRLSKSNTLTVNGTLDLGGYVDMDAKGPVTGGDKGKITVNENASLTFSAGMVAVDGNGKITNNAVTGGTINLNDGTTVDAASSVIGSATQEVIVSGEVTVVKGGSITISGQLTIEEGAELILEEGATLQINSIGKVDLKGTITIEATDANADYVMVTDKGSKMDISGTLDIEGKDSASIVGTMNVTGIVNIGEGATATLTADSTIAAGGNLNVEGAVTGEVTNAGTITIDSEIAFGSLTVYMMDASTLNLDNAVGTVTADDSKMQYKVGGNDEKIKNPSKVEFQNVAGVIVTDSLVIKNELNEQTEKEERNGYGNLCISGNADLATNEADDLTGPATITVTGGVVNVAEGATLDISKDAALEVKTGELLVAGTLTNINKEAKDITNSGEITVTGLLQTYKELKGTVNAAMYEDADLFNYTTLAKAIAAGATDIELTGTIDIDADVTIPVGTTVSSKDATVNIDEDATLTVAADATSSAKFKNDTVNVDGTMVVQNLKKSGVNADDVISDVSTTDGVSATYTNIYKAVAAAQDGETVTITKGGEGADAGVVTLDKNLTIPAGVTLEIPAEKEIEVEAGVTVTVNGTLSFEDGEYTMLKAAAGSNKEDAKTIVNGLLETDDTSTYAIDDDRQIVGAYFMVDGLECIAPLAYAASVINDVESDVEIIGDVTAQDVTVNYTADEGYAIVVPAGSSLTAGTITMSGIDFEFLGKVNATIAVAEGSFTLKDVTGDITSNPNVAGVISDVTTFDDNNNEIHTATLSGKILNAKNPDKTNEDLKGMITVNGTVAVNVTSIGSGFTVAEGATATVGEAGASFDGKTVVNGELVIDAASVTFDGIVVVYGTISATEDGTATANAQVRIGYDENKGYVDGIAAGAVSGLTLGSKGVAIVTPGATFTAVESQAEDMLSTEYYIEDALWMTAYAYSSNDIPDLKAQIENAYFDAWQNSEKTAIYDTSNKTYADIGAEKFQQVYANIDYNIYIVEVIADEGIGTVYLDGKVMTKNSNTFELIENGQPVELAAGQHEIAFVLKNSFSGDVKMYVNGEAVSGYTFTLQGTNDDNESPVVYTINLVGVEPTAPVTPSGDSGSDGMGLTDILLIVLVVLIVIMAVIVALRLMRS